MITTAGNLTSFAQYPTTKTIKGQDVVIMTVPQAKAIDNKFLLLKDSVKLLSISLYQNRENLRITSEALTKTNKSLTSTQESLSQTMAINEAYIKEIEKYKKMEFEDKKVKMRVTIGLTSALVVWLTVFITGISQ